MSIDSYIDRAEHELRGHRVTMVNPVWTLGTGLTVGNAFTIVPGNQIWEMLTVTFLYVSSVTVATRSNALEYRTVVQSPASVSPILDSSGTFASFPSNATQAASLSVRYTYSGQGGTGVANATALKNFIAVPRLILLPGTSIVIVGANIQANDAVSSVLSQFLAYDIRSGELAGADDDPERRPSHADDLAELQAAIAVHARAHH